MVSHPETGSDSPIGSDRDQGRDMVEQIKTIIYFFHIWFKIKTIYLFAKLIACFSNMVYN